MPTPSEQKALAFFALVILLGGAARVVRASSLHPPTVEEQSALARQTAAAETAAVKTRKPRKAAKGAKLTRSRRDDGVDTVGGVVSVPFSDVRPDRPFAGGSQEASRQGWVNGYPPPSPRIDTDNRLNQLPAVSAPAGGRPGRGKARNAASDSAVVIDLDVATLDEIDALPRIGPTMAARLLANRDSFGPFRSLDGLRRVKGMGPATLRLLAPRVTFSGRSASTSTRSRY